MFLRSQGGKGPNPPMITISANVELIILLLASLCVSVLEEAICWTTCTEKKLSQKKQPLPGELFVCP